MTPANRRVLCYHTTNMIRSNVRQHQPVYRDVLKHALLTAWRDRRYWPLAFFASVLLTGSSYDMMLRSLDSITSGTLDFGGKTLPSFGPAMHAISINMSNMLNALFALQAAAVIAVVILAFLAVSCMAQGGLVYALGATIRGKRPALGTAFSVGGSAFWPVAAINALAIALVWMLRFLVAFALYLAIHTPGHLTTALYAVSFFLFVPLMFLILIVQVFSLNAMILQGAPVAEAVQRSYQLFKKHWVTILETAGILFLMTICLGVLSAGLIFVGLVPLLLIILLAAFLKSQLLLSISLGVALALLLIGAFCVAAFTTQLQYATWSSLYRKLGEGGVVPKIHRWVRGLMGTFSVPIS